MSQSTTGKTDTRQASDSINTFRIVRQNSANTNKANLCSSSATYPLGVSLYSASEDEIISYVIDGTAKVKMNGTVGINEPLTATASGEATATITSGSYILGHTLHSASDNDIVEVDLTARGTKYLL